MLYNNMFMFYRREKGAITEVKNQHQCGACYVYATVQTVESMAFRKTGQLRNLSIQQVLDCHDVKQCYGGDSCKVLDWLYRNKVNLQTEDDYPITRDTLELTKCDLEKYNKPGIRVRDYSCNE